MRNRFGLVAATLLCFWTVAPAHSSAVAPDSTPCTRPDLSGAESVSPAADRLDEDVRPIIPRIPGQGAWPDDAARTRILKLLDDLDDVDFDIRQNARAELRKSLDGLRAAQFPAFLALYRSKERSSEVNSSVMTVLFEHRFFDSAVISLASGRSTLSSTDPQTKVEELLTEPKTLKEVAQRKRAILAKLLSGKLDLASGKGTDQRVWLLTGTNDVNFKGEVGESSRELISLAFSTPYWDYKNEIQTKLMSYKEMALESLPQLSLPEAKESLKQIMDSAPLNDKLAKYDEKTRAEQLDHVNDYALFGWPTFEALKKFPPAEALELQKSYVEMAASHTLAVPREEAMKNMMVLDPATAKPWLENAAKSDRSPEVRKRAMITYATGFKSEGEKLLKETREKSSRDNVSATEAAFAAYQAGAPIDIGGWLDWVHGKYDHKSQAYLAEVVMDFLLKESQPSPGAQANSAFDPQVYLRRFVADAPTDVRVHLLFHAVEAKKAPIRDKETLDVLKSDKNSLVKALWRIYSERFGLDETK